MLKKHLSAVMSFLFLFLWISAASGTTEGSPVQQLKQKLPTALRLPDLVLEKIELSSQAAGDNKKNVSISYWVYNNSTASSICCPTEEGKKAWQENPSMNTLYRIRVEGRSLPSGSFSVLGYSGANVTTKTDGRERQKYTATDTCSIRARREYRVTIDYGNWIHERKEDNNQLTKTLSNTN